MSSMFYMLTVDDVVTVDVINIVVVVDAIIEVDVDAVDINKVINVHDIVDIVNVYTVQCCRKNGEVKGGTHLWNTNIWPCKEIKKMVTLV